MQKQSSLSNHSAKFRIRYEEQLNFSQPQAVTTTEGPLLVIAGAGSGKTRTLTYRVARLVENGVSPASILLLTFTRKAAHQMLLRATNLLDRRCEGVGGGTFHSFGNIILRKYASTLGFNPGFAILDRVDAEALISILRKEKGLAVKHRWGLKRLKRLFSTVDTHQMSLAKLGATIIEYYLPILKGKYDDHPKRAKDLEQLLAIMERYNDLSLYLTDMALEPPNTSIGDTFSATAGTPADNRLTLSTIHSAKDLEWHTVFIIWALDGRFPSPHALYKEEELEEELRLMYVAATRARENLIFTYPNQVYDRMLGMVLDRPSRFIDMIQQSILEKQSARFFDYDS